MAQFLRYELFQFSFFIEYDLKCKIVNQTDISSIKLSSRYFWANESCNFLKANGLYCNHALIVMKVQHQKTVMLLKCTKFDFWGQSRPLFVYFCLFHIIQFNKLIKA